jgi:hypothetical protein
VMSEIQNGKSKYYNSISSGGMLMNWKKIILSVLFLVLVHVFCDSVQAISYFSWDAESYPCDGSVLPNPPFWTQEVSHRGIVVCGSTPQGSRFFEFQTVNSQADAYTEIQPNPPFPITGILNKTLYLAYFFNFTRIGGLDVWHESGDSADKGIEFVGSGVRWILSRGHWSNLANNIDHNYTVWAGNPTYHLNAGIENNDIYRPNQSGYSDSSSIQLSYDTWHSAVMAVKFAADNTGSVTVWINGVKILQYDNIKTAANTSPTINQIIMGGTIAQPAYDAPAHKRRFDAMILTDNWQDIINGGYLSGSSPSPVGSSPSPPVGLKTVGP